MHRLKSDCIQYNTIPLFKEGGVITYYSFLTYGSQNKKKENIWNMHNIEVNVL